MVVGASLSTCKNIVRKRFAPLSSLFHVLLAMVFFSYRPTVFVEGDLFIRDVPHLGKLEQPNRRRFSKRFSKGNPFQNRFALGLCFFVVYPGSSFPEDVYVFPLSNPHKH